MKVNRFYVYHLIDPFTGFPFYVGKGTGNRMYDHEKLTLSEKIPNKNPILFRKIKKIILSNNILYKKILENLTENEAFLLEQSEIKKYGRMNDKTGILCNMTNGGEGISGHKHSYETKKRISILHSGKNNPFYGKHHTTKNLKKIRESSLGNKNSRGLIHTKEIIKKLSLLGKKKIVSKETRVKMSIARKGKPTNVPINQFNEDMNLIKHWNSLSQAANTLNIAKSCISDCLHNKMKTYKGYIWKYE